ncbi:hypothetical protein VB834_23270 [Limnoraphis robusta Tam1]|uniref:Uncharacterized protein n=1 Tax=Limnoraphis robusta CCNP1315 TaxID=3110306 RepID=A0ABU5U5T4_9CYAN|nr:hypothetical protein [Limnoraphis robusta]MEA5521503.1 hypothetical protein [Limnoraphis robusta CCNP1315]MEA5541957.1 hypothetical protein [Limnoraphis robusta Tam1]MEA5543953.1 hypothetical protein [Limnoraphis robusta CCNP1324]
MKRLLSLICLLGFGASPILSFSTGVSATAQTKPTEISAFCQNEQQVYAFAQWTRLVYGPVDPSSVSAGKTDNITQILNLLKAASGTPRTTQLAIDRFTPLLPSLIERTPAAQRAQLLPLVDQLVTIAKALPPGYNYAQSRALIAAAIAYNKLNQPSRSTPLLQQANQTLVGIAVPSLKAETQWSLAEAWFTMGQKSLGQASLAAATATLKTLSPKSPPLENNLPNQLVDSYLRQGQWSQAEAAARAIPILTQQSEQLFRIASAYLRAKQVKPALALFDKTIAQLLKASPIPQSSADVATEGIISFAQAGGVTTAIQAAKQLPSQKPALRAKAWLAIAGEARQQKRPKEAALALEQLVAVGQIGKKQGFGSGFGTLRDVEWSGSLYDLSRSQGYVPEMLQFIERLNLKTQAVEFLITEAVRAKRFDEAQRLIPKPMRLVIDVGVFEVQDSWRWWVAGVAAQEGKPQQLIALSEEILPKVGTSSPIELSPWNIPETLDISPSSSNSPPYFLIDIRPAPSLPEGIAIQAIHLLQLQGQTEMAGRLGTALANQAEELLRRQPTVKLYADQHPLLWVHNLERYLRLQQQTITADRLYALEVDYLKQIEDLEQRAALIPFTSSLDDPRGAITNFIQFAETMGVADQTQTAKRIFEVAVFSGQTDIMTEWRPRAQFSPREQADLMIQAARMVAVLEEKIVRYDQILKLIQEQPQNSLLINNYELNSMIESYLFKGQIDKVKQVISLIDDSHEARRQQERLDCLTTAKITPD